MTTVTFTKTAPPSWLLAMWKEIDDKTFGKGFDCFAEDAICNLGVADWHGREAIRNNLRQFIDKGFTALHDVVEYLGQPAVEDLSWQGRDDLRRSRHRTGAADHDAFLLHGRKGSDQGQALGRIGRADRLLRPMPSTDGEEFRHHGHGSNGAPAFPRMRAARSPINAA